MWKRKKGLLHRYKNITHFLCKPHVVSGLPVPSLPSCVLTQVWVYLGRQSFQFPRFLALEVALWHRFGQLDLSKVPMWEFWEKCSFLTVRHSFFLCLIPLTLSMIWCLEGWSHLRPWDESHRRHEAGLEATLNLPCLTQMTQVLLHENKKLQLSNCYQGSVACSQT